MPKGSKKVAYSVAILGTRYYIDEIRPNGETVRLNLGQTDKSFVFLKLKQLRGA